MPLLIALLSHIYLYLQYHYDLFHHHLHQFSEIRSRTTASMYINNSCHTVSLQPLLSRLLSSTTSRLQHFKHQFIIEGDEGFSIFTGNVQISTNHASLSFFFMFFMWLWLSFSWWRCVLTNLFPRCISPSNHRIASLAPTFSFFSKSRQSITAQEKNNQFWINLCVQLRQENNRIGDYEPS